jgi:hypothetical protein
MTDIADDDTEDVDRIAATADIRREAWSATLEDMDATADELEAEGWDTIRIPAGDTGAFGTDDEADDDTFGLMYVIPGDRADAVEAAVEGGSFPKFEVYRAEQNGLVYLVTVLLDPDTETAILVAGQFELRKAVGCARAAVEHDEMWTHLRRLDGTPVASFHHEDYEKFFPSVTEVENWAGRDLGE